VQFEVAIEDRYGRQIEDDRKAHQRERCARPVREYQTIRQGKFQKGCADKACSEASAEKICSLSGH
jgi:hypothetical protein